MSPRLPLALLLFSLLVPAALAAAPTPPADAGYDTILNIDVEGYSLQGSTLAGYFHGASLDRIVARHYGCSGRLTEEITLEAGKVTFILSTLYQYDRSKVACVTTITETTRYYFTNNRLTRCLVNDTTVSLTPERITDAAETLKSAREFAARLNLDLTRRDRAATFLRVMAEKTGYSGTPGDSDQVAAQHSIDYPKCIRDALFGNHLALHSLLAVSSYLDAPESRGHAAVLAALREALGDSYFDNRLKAESPLIRKAVANVQLYDLPPRPSTPTTHELSEAEAVAKNHGVDYRKTMQRAMARDPRALHTLFTLSTHFDAASAEEFEDDLETILRTVGDDFFAATLRQESSKLRTEIITAYFSFIFERPNPPLTQLAHLAYPKTFALSTTH